MRLIFIFLFSLVVSACTSTENKSSNQYRSADQTRPSVDPKYSLSADREALAEIREQIPAEKKVENDELAYMDNLFSGQREPTQIRTQFDTLVRKKRSQFDKDISKERETFNKEERKKRDTFLKEQKQTRDSFNRSKQDRDVKNEFYREQDQKRSEYFADERDRRNDFESDVRERRKNFDDYIRQKNGDFNIRYRAYSQQFNEFRKPKQPNSTVLESGE